MAKKYRVMPKEMQIKSAAMLLKKNYNIEPDLIDLRSEIDSTLTFGENWNLIEEKYVHRKLKGGVLR
jgi:hypothetical protein